MQQRYPPSQVPPVSNKRARQRSRFSNEGVAGGVGGSSPAAAAAAVAAATTPGGNIGGRLDSRLPPRTTKVSQKLVLLPETGRGEEEEEEAKERDDEEEEEEEEEEADNKGGNERLGGEGEQAAAGTVGGRGRGIAMDEGQLQRVAEERGVDPEVLRAQLLRKGRKTVIGGGDGDGATTAARGETEFDIDNDSAPLLAQEESFRRRRPRPEGTKSYAERLPKARRTEKVARVTAYCTAQAYKMGSVASFVKEWHGGRMKLYDDCLYTAYQLPFLPGHEGYRLRSSPTVRYPGGKSLLDEEIERNELRDHHEEYNMAEVLEHSVGGRSHAMRASAGNEDGTSTGATTSIDYEGERQQQLHDGATHGDATVSSRTSSGQDNQRSEYPSQGRVGGGVPSKYLSVAEMFVFSYGVVVFWNFTEHQEKDLLADLAFATSSVTGTPVLLATLPLHEEDFETEEFHFEYSTEISRPRVYNDMITLRSGDHMIKLAISHGIAQSTKLCFFEEVMARQMAEAKDVPRRLATTGKLGMKREEVFRILGRLFKSRVEVNLCE